MPNLIPIIVFALGACLAFVVYRYKNRIAFEVTTIPFNIPENSVDIKLAPFRNMIQAERLTIKGYGLRNLENVELHFKCLEPPIVKTVYSTDSLSKSVIKLEWNDGLLTISIPRFPSSEEIQIDILRVGYWYPEEFRLQGTGGPYKIVRLKYYKLKRDAVILFIWLVAVTWAPILYQIIKIYW